MQFERKIEFDTKFMKSTTKNKLLEVFLKNLQEKHGLDEKKAWKVANDLSTLANDMLQETNQGISEAYNLAIQEMEQQRKQFRDHIEFIEKRFKVINDSFLRQKFYVIDKDKKTGKTILVGRTAMVTEMVDFLNDLNKLVADFYINVYKLDEQGAKENGIFQTSLF